MQTLRYINYLLAFGLELVLIFSVAFWGYSSGKTTLTKWAFAIILFVAVAALWGIYAAPKSFMRIRFPWLNLFKIAMFSLGTLAFIGLEKTRFAVIYSILSIISVAISYFDETSS